MQSNNPLIDRTTRLKRLYFRSAHRGSKEADIILGPFAKAHLEAMDDAALSEFEQFLEESDPDIWEWVMGACEPSGGRYAKLLGQLRAQRANSGD